MTQNINPISQSKTCSYKMLSKNLTCNALKAEYKELTQNPNILPGELTVQLKQLKHRVTKLRNSTSKTQLLNKIDTLLNKKNKCINKRELRNRRENILITSKQEKSQKTLFQHLVLDSLANIFPKMICNSGIHESISLAYIGPQLLEFSKYCESDDRAEVLNLYKSFQLSQDIAEIRELPSEKDPETNLTNLINLTLKKMSSGKHNYPLLISAGTQSHAVILNITFSEKAQYYITLINTGANAERDNESDLIVDLQFRNITLQDMQKLPWIILDRPKKYSVFLERMKKNFNKSNNQGYALLNRGQRGSSCASKSLTCSLKYNMPCNLKREFKVFMTENLLKNQENPLFKRLGGIILKKRKLKLTLSQLDMKREQLKSFKEDIELYEKTLDETKILFQKIEHSYNDNIDPEENIRHAKSTIFSELSTITNPDHLRQIVRERT